jgi:CheY-like chemotaxis protein
MPFKLLIVDDNAESRAFLGSLFRLKGYNIATACSGTEGLYTAILERPNLIITELCLPRMCAGEMIRLIRAEAETTDIPILVYTSQGREHTELAKAAGADLFFLKHLELDELTQNVAFLLPKPNGK